MATLLAVPQVVGAGEIDCAGCHPGKLEGRSVHTANRYGCMLCHIGVDASSVPHKMVSGVTKGLPAEPPRLCHSCHKKEKLLAGAILHAPVSGGMCTACHDTHSSDYESLLVSEEVCLDCHGGQGFKSKKNIHSPVASSRCSACHEPHSSRHQKLLRSTAPGLCFGCHDNREFEDVSVHAPARLGMCLSCHEPHQSDHPGLTRTDMPGLCLACHESGSLGARDMHVSSAGTGCTECHSPHSSNRNHLLLRNSR